LLFLQPLLFLELVDECQVGVDLPLDFCIFQHTPATPILTFIDGKVMQLSFEINEFLRCDSLPGPEIVQGGIIRLMESMLLSCNVRIVIIRLSCSCTSLYRALR